MILVDTGPLVALFDPKDRYHARSRSVLQSLREPLLTTIPVLTEAFHLLTPGSKGALALGNFVKHNGLASVARMKRSVIREIMSQNPGFHFVPSGLLAIHWIVFTRKSVIN